MAGYLRELARVVAAARGVGAGANASAKAVFGAVSAARKGVERRDLEVRLLALPVLNRPTLFQYSYSPGAAAVLLLPAPSSLVLRRSAAPRRADTYN